jgi:hypothetical protein
MAMGLTAALSQLPGVLSVRQQAEYRVGEHLPNADLCFELLGGIGIALEAAMQALAQGMGLVVGSPALAASHGKMLQGAAMGQGAFFAVAAHGLAVAPQHLQAAQAEGVMILPDSPAQTILRRMAERHETPATATAQLHQRGTDLTDLAGKETHSRAHALLGAWQGQWLSPSQQPRQGVDALEPAHLRMAAELGLTVAFGSHIGATHIYTGPLALPTDMPAPTMGTETLIATTAFGPLAWQQPTRLGYPAALLGAGQRAISGPMLRHPAPQSAAKPTATATLLIGPQSARGHILALGTLQTETFNGAWWGGVLSGQANLGLLPPGVLALPIPLPYTATAAPYLRLVG